MNLKQNFCKALVLFNLAGVFFSDVFFRSLKNDSSQLKNGWLELAGWKFHDVILVKVTCICYHFLWNGHTVDGGNPANQLIGSLSHYLQRVLLNTSQVVQSFTQQQ